MNERTDRTSNDKGISSYPLRVGTLVAIWCGGWLGILVDIDHILNPLFADKGKPLHLVALYVGCVVFGTVCAYVCGLGLAKKILRQ